MTKVKAVGTRGLTNLTYGKEYELLHGIEPGMVPTRPFVTVIDDNGKEFHCHASRFMLNGRYLDDIDRSIVNGQN